MGRLKVFFHDNCFDGTSSASLFGDFYRRRIDENAEVILEGVQHKTGDPFAGRHFDGDDNVCVDFRYTDNPLLTWWFDHHVSAFQPASLRDHFEADTGGQKFYDPTAPSNTKFMAGILRDKFGYVGEGYEEVIEWADIIDSAAFPSAEMVVALEQPALRLMTWLENNHDPELTHRYIRELGRRTLAEIAENEWITRPLAPLLEAHQRNIELIRQRAQYDNGVVYFDLTEDGVIAHNKFIAYMLFPDARYTVGVTHSPERSKISVGSNPWAKETRTHNIAELCERYGGGGHPVVGGVSVGGDEVDRARQISVEIRDILAGR